MQINFDQSLILSLNFGDESIYLFWLFSQKDCDYLEKGDLKNKVNILDSFCCLLVQYAVVENSRYFFKNTTLVIQSIPKKYI